MRGEMDAAREAPEGGGERAEPAVGGGRAPQHGRDTSPSGRSGRGLEIPRGGDGTCRSRPRWGPHGRHRTGSRRLSGDPSQSRLWDAGRLGSVP
jgi:hypothetical protein